MTSKSDKLKIRTDHPDSWIAVEAGDHIRGKVLDVTEAWSDQRQQGSWYPLLTIQVVEAPGYDNSVTELKVHGFGTVLYNEIMRHQPEVGETVVITYNGTGEAKKRGQNPPELYRLRVEGRTDAGKRAYGRIGQSQPSNATQAARQPQEPPQEPVQQPLAGEEDLPF